MMRRMISPMRKAQRKSSIIYVPQLAYLGGLDKGLVSSIEYLAN